MGQGATSNLAYVFGTSSCTMTTTREPVFVPGVWGPYYSAMVPGLWLNEGGQSAAGAAIDQLLLFHPAADEAKSLAKSKGVALPVLLADMAIEKAKSASRAVELARGLHVVPEFLGNRAPFADPHARAIVAGLGMERDLDGLVALYVAGLCGIGYGLRQIIEVQAEAGAPVETIVISGGAGQHPLTRQILADSCGMSVVTPVAEEPVILGSAMLGAVAAGTAASVMDAMKNMSAAKETVVPASATLQVHNDRFAAYKILQRDGRLIRNC